MLGHLGCLMHLYNHRLLPNTHTQDVLRAWLLQDTTTRTRKNEDRCLVVRQAKRASGLRLFLRSDDKHSDGTLPTLMGIRPVDRSINSNSSSSSSDYTVAVASAQEPEEVCMLHFQGPKSKQLIKPFNAFLEGGSGNVKKEEGGREEFVLP